PTIGRVVNAPLYPFDYAAAVDEIAAAAGQYRDRAAGEVDLAPVVDDLARLKQAILDWRSAADRAIAMGSAGDRRRTNATLRRLARILVPLNYARGERFDHDPAVKLPVVPRLEIATRLANAPPDRKRFLKTALVRERNKVRAMIRAAMREITAPAYSA